MSESRLRGSRGLFGIAACAFAAAMASGAFAQGEGLPCDNTWRGPPPLGSVGDVGGDATAEFSLIRWHLWASHAAYGFDTFEGDAIRGAWLGTSRVSAQLHLFRKKAVFKDIAVYLSVPHVEYAFVNGAGDRIHEQGLGDFEWGAFFGLRSKQRDQPVIWLGAGGTLPTGDDDRGLGLGDPTYNVGIALTHEWEGDGDEPARWAVHVSAGHEWNGADSDLDRWRLRVGMEGSVSRVWWHAALESFLATSDTIQLGTQTLGGPDDLELSAGVRVFLVGEEGEKWRGPFLGVGLRSALDTDLLSDDLTLVAEFGWMGKPKKKPPPK